MLAGVVLTGGSSRRMGRTKALMEIDGVPMATRVAAALEKAGCVTVVALGGDPEELSELDLAVLPDEYPGQGPLGGVISALGASPSAATGVAVVACDLPWLSADDFKSLVVAAQNNPTVDVVIARTNRLEPACAVWSPDSLPALREIFESGERSLYAAIGQLASIEIAIDPRAMRNVNTPADLQQHTSP